jgi:hypothetical protein
MPYSVSLPDGRAVEFPDEVSHEQAASIIKAQLYFGKLTPPPTEQAGFFGSAKEALEQVLDTKKAATFLNSAPGAQQDAARKELLDAEQSKYLHTSFGDIKDLGSAVNFAKEQAGSFLGGYVAPFAVSAITKNPELGVAAIGAQRLTQNAVRQAQEQQQQIEQGKTPQTTSFGKAITATATQTALDVAGLKFFGPVFSKFPIVGKLFGAEGADAAAQTEEQIVDAFNKGNISIVGGIARGIGKGVVFEVPKQIAQQVAERWQAGQSLTGPDANNEYLQAGASAVLIGGGLGGMSGWFNGSYQKAKARQLIRAKEEVKKDTT